MDINFKQFHIADYVIFTLVLAFSTGVGIFYCLSGGRQRTTEEYVLGNRQMGLLPVAASTLVSFVSAITVQGIPAEAYLYGLQYLFYGTGGCLGCFIVALVFVPLFYPLRMTSVYEYLEGRFQSRLARQTGSILSILTSTIFMGVVIFGPSVALQGVIGVPVWISMLIMAIFCTFYTTIGGIKAVIWADVLQAVIMITSIIIILIVGTMKTGGISEVWTLLKAGERTTVFDWNPNPTMKSNFWIIEVALLSYWTITFLQQACVQRMNSLPSMVKCKVSMLLTGIGFAVFGCLSVLLGAVIYSYYAKIACDPVKAGKITNVNQLVPYFVVDALNYPGFPGLFVACLYSAALSSLSSSQNSCATCLWEDICKPFFPNISEARRTLAIKMMALLFGILAFGMGFLVNAVGDNVFQIAAAFISSPLGPILGMYILGGAFTFTTGTAASISAFIGMAFSLWIGVGRVFCGTWWDPPLATTTHGCMLNNASSMLNESHTIYTDDSIIIATESPVKYYSIAYDNRTLTGFYSDQNHNITADVTETSSSCAALLGLYSLSPMVTPLLGTLVTVIMGLVLSLIHNCIDTRDFDVEEKYIFPCLRRCLMKGKHDSTFVYFDAQSSFIKDKNEAKESRDISELNGTTESLPLKSYDTSKGRGNWT